MGSSRAAHSRTANTKRRWDRRTGARHALLAVAVAVSTIAAVGPAGATTVPAQVHIAVETTTAFATATDPGRCLGVWFAEFTAIDGATSYTARLADGFFGSQVGSYGTSQPFANDSYSVTGGAIVVTWTAPGGTHRRVLHSYSSGQGCSNVLAVGGARWTVVSATAEVPNLPPTAAFSWQVDGDEPLRVAFDASASTDDKGIASYEWDFGDGNAGSGVTPAPHDFADPGTYPVELTVVDTDGVRTALTRQVSVSACAPPSQLSLRRDLVQARASITETDILIRVRNTAGAGVRNVRVHVSVSCGTDNSAVTSEPTDEFGFVRVPVSYEEGAQLVITARPLGHFSPSYHEVSDPARDTVFEFQATDACFDRPVTVLGTDDDDSIDLLAGDVAVTLDGLDSIAGGAGTDPLAVCGGDKKDIIDVSGTSSNLLDGGPGDDEIYSSDGDDLILAGDGNDTVRGRLGNDTIWGGAGDDYLVGSTGCDSVHGEGDNDTLFGDRDADSSTACPGGGLYGEGGNDVMFGGPGDDLLDGGPGCDDISGQDGEDVIEGGDDSDGPSGCPNGGLDGGRDKDVIRGGPGLDMLRGGHGDDTLSGGNDSDDLDGGADADKVDGGEGADLLAGSGGNDELNGGTENDRVDGGAGCDAILGEGGDDQLFGGDGDDSSSTTCPRGGVFGGDGSDNVEGGIGSDLLRGEGGCDRLAGGDGGDDLDGGDGDDIPGVCDGGGIYGEDGWDVMSGGIGNDRLDGGDGQDIVKGDDGDDFLQGEAGKDTLDGGGGSDTIRGGDGEDTIDGDGTSSSPGVDHIYGEVGQDTIKGGDEGAGACRDGDVIDGGDEKDNINGGGGGDRILGGNGPDTIKGESGCDDIYGGEGKDIIDAGANPDGTMDLVWGEAGNDTIAGGDGEDLLYGGAGWDTLIGGPGNDWLEGGVHNGPAPTVYPSDQQNHTGDEESPLGTRDDLDGSDGEDHCVSRRLDLLVSCEQQVVINGALIWGLFLR